MVSLESVFAENDCSNYMISNPSFEDTTDWWEPHQEGYAFTDVRASDGLLSARVNIKNIKQI